MFLLMIKRHKENENNLEEVNESRNQTVPEVGHCWKSALWRSHLREEEKKKSASLYTRNDRQSQSGVQVFPVVTVRIVLAPGAEFDWRLIKACIMYGSVSRGELDGLCINLVLAALGEWTHDGLELQSDSAGWRASPPSLRLSLRPSFGEASS